MNIWSIPEPLERDVRERDKSCIYCGVVLIDKAAPGGSRADVGTWEHIINDANIVTLENIARCCCACNASKGAKLLGDWIKSPYCVRRDINKYTVADVVKVALKQAM